MGKIKPYPPVKLIAAITISDLKLWKLVKDELEEHFSPIDSFQDWYDFTFTEYYREEMGANLKKRMVSFQDLISAEQLPEMKILSNQIEDKFSESGNRRVNIDPGYVTSAKLILATTKDYMHRIYLGKGIFGDLHLRIRQGEFQPLDWTYPDYRQPEVLHFFNEVRKIYLAQLALENDWGVTTNEST
ncbi:MAG: DUF4416 family protein [Calditrichaeota bacterium]|nr:MAG: DUF4416 family protein [Calditrichota bacterium]